MRNILAIAGKELRAYFHSPIAYFIIAFYTGLSGFFFYNLTAEYVVQTFRMEAMGGMGAPPMSLNAYVIRPMFEGILTVVLLLLLPLVTMRLYAEEKRSGTLELLLTSPITDLEILFGKFFGALALYIVLIVLTFAYIGTLFIYGNPDAKPLLAVALGIFLFGSALLALGMWISTLTKNQIIAAGVSFGVFLLLYVFNWVSAYSTSVAGRVMAYLSFTTHFDNFAKGVIDLQDLVYYVSVVALGIFLTSRSVQALKGRAS